jgi:choline dehydrogenase-like flavoprotein
MRYDAIIIGSGAGGSAAAFHLTQTGKRVLLLEKGMVLPKDGSTLDVEKVVKHKLFLDDDPWLDKDGRTVVPQERSNLGGKTKWYGAALLRFAPEEFGPDAAHQCLPWPFGYEELEPFYAEAERLLGVRYFPIEPDFQKIVTGLRSRDPQWRKQPLPVGLAPDILAHPEEAKHFDAFASPRGLKSDAENRFLDRVRGKPNLEILTGKKVIALQPAASGATRVSGVQCEDGSQYEADIVLLAGGALHSPRLLQTYVETNGLAGKLACYNQIGRNYKFHLLTAMLMLTWAPQTDVLRKTTVLLHDALPHSSVQPLGWMDGELLAPELPGFVPRWVADVIGKRVYGFFLQTEDGSHPDNRIVAQSNGSGMPQLNYDAARIPAARAEHRHFVRLLQRQLLGIGYVGLVKPIPITGTAHACGTLVTGNEPATSVVDAEGKVHGLDNLYVVDGSVLPRSSRVNPALTIYAWGLRVASHLTARALNSKGQIHGHSVAGADSLRT